MDRQRRVTASNGVLLHRDSNIVLFLPPRGCDNAYKTYSCHPQAVPIRHTSSDPVVNTQVPGFKTGHSLGKQTKHLSFGLVCESS